VNEREARIYEWWAQAVKEFETFKQSGYPELKIDIADLDDVIKNESAMLFNAMAGVHDDLNKGFTSSWPTQKIAEGFLMRLYLHQRKKGWK
jgi:hypothetical protein